MPNLLARVNASSQTLLGSVGTGKAGEMDGYPVHVALRFSWEFGAALISHAAQYLGTNLDS